MTTFTDSGADRTITTEITTEPIEVDRVQRLVQSVNCGATVLFLGTTRRRTGDHETRTLVYQCYEDMARSEMERLGRLAMDRWPVHHVALIHRMGEVPLGQASVAVAVSSPHREEAFRSAEWLIDELKKTVPIWKQDHATDGAVTWSHPVAAQQIEAPTQAGEWQRPIGEAKHAR